MDAKRLHIVPEMYRNPAGDLIATAEQLLLHVDTRAGRAAPFPGPVAARLRKIRAAHAALPVPSHVGRPIRIPAAEA